MNITQVYAVYFSATGNTRKVTTTLANALAVSFDVPLEVRDFTLPAAREEAYEFAAGDLVVFGMPTYAGKLPNKLLDFVKSGFHGNGALAVPVVTFGNRSFDNSLAELCACLEGDGFHTIGAGAFACRHAFTDALANGRPDSDDMAELAKLGSAVVGRIVRMTEYPAPITGDRQAASDREFTVRMIDRLLSQLRANMITQLDGGDPDLQLASLVRDFLPGKAGE